MFVEGIQDRTFNSVKLEKIDEVLDLLRTHNFWGSQPIMKILDPLDPSNFHKPVKQKVLQDIK